MREALQAALAADPQFTVARLQIASLDELAKQYDEAMVQYRAILAYAPDQPVALNNLAYSLAVRKGAAEEALPLAERAAAINGTFPTFLDTKAWVQHLLGRDADALKSIEAALTGTPPPTDADLFFHAAAIYSGAKDPVRGRAMLDKAVKLRPSIADRPDVKELQQRLAGRQ
jgi:tetratricopeptide (TPR) repeat protein